MEKESLNNLLSNYNPKDIGKTGIYFCGLNYELTRSNDEITMNSIKEIIPPSSIPYLSHILNKHIQSTKEEEYTQRSYHRMFKVHNLLNQYRLEHAKNSKSLGYSNIDNWDDNQFVDSLAKYLSKDYFLDKIKLNNNLKNPIFENPLQIKNSEDNDFENNNLESKIQLSDDGVTYSLFNQEELNGLPLNESHHNKSDKENKTKIYNNKKDKEESREELKRIAKDNKSIGFIPLTPQISIEQYTEEMEKRGLF